MGPDTDARERGRDGSSGDLGSGDVRRCGFSDMGERVRLLRSVGDIPRLMGEKREEREGVDALDTDGERRRRRIGEYGEGDRRR